MPRSVEGRGIAAMAHLIIGQARTGFGGFAGLDLPAVIEILERSGIDPDIAALLLPHWEQGLLAAAAKRNEDT